MRYDITAPTRTLTHDHTAPRIPSQTELFAAVRETAHHGGVLAVHALQVEDVVLTSQKAADAAGVPSFTVYCPLVDELEWDSLRDTFAWKVNDNKGVLILGDPTTAPHGSLRGLERFLQSSRIQGIVVLHYSL